MKQCIKLQIEKVGTFVGILDGLDEGAILCTVVVFNVDGIALGTLVGIKETGLLDGLNEGTILETGTADGIALETLVGITEAGVLDGLDEGAILGTVVVFFTDGTALGTLVGIAEAGTLDGLLVLDTSPTLYNGAVTDSVIFFQAAVKLPKNG